MVTLILAAIAAGAAPSPVHAAGRFILNEALANEPGSATSLEWVEILHWPDTGAAVSLGDYILVDGTDTTRFQDTDSIPAGGFAVLARRPLGASSFESFWGNNSGVWGDHPSESYSLFTANIALRNSSDTLVLIHKDGDTSAIFWTRDGGDNISVERIRPGNDDSAPAFGLCIDPSGSTPGRANSLLPARGDLALDSVRVLTPSPGFGDTIDVIIHFTNVGFGNVESVTIELYDDAIPQSEGDPLVFIGQAEAGPIAEGLAMSVTIPWSGASPGRHGLIARIVADGNSLNNTASTGTAIRFTEPLVIVTEFLANPEVGGPDEWIEISNRAPFPINMAGCMIGDSTALSPFPASAALMQPGEFWVFVENEIAFRAFYPGFDGTLHRIGTWRSLNNTGDRIRLVGPSGEIIDSLSYRRDQTFDGNHSSERIDLSPMIAPPSYWRQSQAEERATPGRANSVFPVDNDVTVDSLAMFPETPVMGEDITIRAYLTNRGIAPSYELRVEIFDDLAFSTPGGLLDFVGRASVPEIAPEERAEVSVVWRGAGPGSHRVVVQAVGPDGTTIDSEVIVRAIRFAGPVLIISEYLADPTTSGPGEWVEIYNAGAVEIGLRGIRLGDSSSSAALPPDAGSIRPGEFRVLCRDENAFMSFYAKEPDIPLIPTLGWAELNNSGDGIRLLGAAGEIIDSLTYRTTYGSNRSSERISLVAQFSQPSDWTMSVDPSGATPGRANSVQRDLAGAFGIEVSPNPFYMARGEATEIAYRLEIGERLSLLIYDRAGRLVRRLADDTPAATGSMFWDGRSDHGGTVPPGPYVLLAKSEPEGAVRKIVVVVGP